MSVLPSHHPCKDCGVCCQYITVIIGEPKEQLDYDAIVWYLLHEGIHVVIDNEGEWLVEIGAHCKRLTHEKKCGDYDNRPGICEDFDSADCHGPDCNESDRRRFKEPEEFIAYLREQGITYTPRAVGAQLRGM